jgi:hypothetical protein
LLDSITPRNRPLVVSLENDREPAGGIAD